MYVHIYICMRFLRPSWNTDSRKLFTLLCTLLIFLEHVSWILLPQYMKRCSRALLAATQQPTVEIRNTTHSARSLPTTMPVVSYLSFLTGTESQSCNKTEKVVLYTYCCFVLPTAIPLLKDTDVWTTWRANLEEMGVSFLLLHSRR